MVNCTHPKVMKMFNMKIEPIEDEIFHILDYKWRDKHEVKEMLKKQENSEYELNTIENAIDNLINKGVLKEKIIEMNGEDEWIFRKKFINDKDYVNKIAKLNDKIKDDNLEWNNLSIHEQREILALKQDIKFIGKKLRETIDEQLKNFQPLIKSVRTAIKGIAGDFQKAIEESDIDFEDLGGKNEE